MNTPPATRDMCRPEIESICARPEIWSASVTWRGKCPRSPVILASAKAPAGPCSAALMRAPIASRRSSIQFGDRQAGQARRCLGLADGATGGSDAGEPERAGMIIAARHHRPRRRIEKGAKPDTLRRVATGCRALGFGSRPRGAKRGDNALDARRSSSSGLARSAPRVAQAR